MKNICIWSGVFFFLLFASCQKEVIVQPDGTFDYNGRTYAYKTIGSQTWMIENLAYLPSLSDQGSWQGADKERRYYVFGYEDTIVNAAKSLLNYTTYGVLYNWPAAMNGDSTSN